MLLPRDLQMSQSHLDFSPSPGYLLVDIRMNRLRLPPGSFPGFSDTWKETMRCLVVVRRDGALTIDVSDPVYPELGHGMFNGRVIDVPSRYQLGQTP
ncbi:hypothetical protein LshimejAT787_0700020 [Lyophyllum shimeji]|uniref:Uncharacterized protein n=1 Tax=Lyophyllum shimeji TaxID=47721 RepID=A0A9P3UNM9_LYOSH|nr:hypothetical protein LshimejAT787_0700020 [Lyophyllum shimeji]